MDNWKRWLRVSSALAISCTILVGGIVPINMWVPSMTPTVKTSVMSVAQAARSEQNQTMMQYFEWDLPNDGLHWSRLRADANHLKHIGVTAVWIPPAYKGGASNDVGYGVYDGYDLGEFNQKGTIRTKYGTKVQLKEAIQSLHANQVSVYMDMVMNHRAFPDRKESQQAIEVNPKNRNQQLSNATTRLAPTGFDFAGRRNAYSSFKFNASHFNGFQEGSRVFLMDGKSWAEDVDQENGNYDFLLFADVDYSNPLVVQEMIRWGTWMVEHTGIDGFRIDAVKHMSFSFMKQWITAVRQNTGKPLVAVAEYLSGNPTLVNNYLDKTEGTMNLFDFELHYKLYQADQANGAYDMRYLLQDTLMMRQPNKAYTFVDNHDTQPGQAIESYVRKSFKSSAYATILTRKEGVPTVFYGDYYGIPAAGVEPLQAKLDPLLLARKHLAYGKQNDYLDHRDVIGWTREGDADRPNSGLATIISDGVEGSKWMYVGTSNAGETWIDMTGNRSEQVTVGSNGWAVFPVNASSYSVYAERSMNMLDRIAPSQPAALKMVSRADSNVRMRWNASTDETDYVTYQIYRDGTRISTTSLTDWTDRGVLPGTNYSYQIYAVDGAGNRSVASNTVSVTTIPENKALNYVQLYYKKGYATPYVHFKQSNGNWTSLPGWQMNDSSLPGWAYLTIPTGSEKSVDLCFNNGSGSWDSRNSKNYQIAVGKAYFIPGVAGEDGTISTTMPAQ